MSIGDGAFSSVWKVKRKSDGIEYALKKVSYRRIDRDLLVESPDWAVNRYLNVDFAIR